MRVTAVAAPVRLPDVGDTRLRMLVLRLERRDEGVFGFDGEHLGAVVMSETDREFHGHDLLRP